MLNKMPFFSVIMPTYNAGIELKKTINSVLNQTFTNFEILIMDDGSVDNTKDLVESFNDNRIKYDWKSNSGGPATPRNRGIMASSGKWVSFLDADDLWYPRKLELVYKAISDESRLKLDVVCHNEILNLHGNRQRKILRYGPFTKDFYSRLLIRGNCLSTSAVSVRKDFLETNNAKFNESSSFTIIEDYDFWLHLANNNAEFLFLNETLGEYVIEEHNISHDTKRAHLNTITVLKNHVFNVQDFEPDKEKLWKYINIKLVLDDLIFKTSLKTLFSNFIKFLKILFCNPVVTLKISCIKLVSRIKSILLS
jgi:glycosyltransferase involved in cell wall biosynthesis